MTARRISISLPEDVAERLDQEDNASAFVASAIRARMRREHMRGILADAGFNITREGIDRMHERVRALEQQRAARRDAA